MFNHKCCVMLVCSFLVVWRVDGGEPQPYGLVGDSNQLWFYDHSIYDGQRSLSFAIYDESTQIFVSPTTLRHLTGEVHASVVAENSLHVFFSGGQHRSYRLKNYMVNARTELPLPGKVLPLALAEAPAWGRIIAIVDLALASGTGLEMPCDTDRCLAIVSYRAGTWSLVCGLPSWVDSHADLWIVSDNNVIQLLSRASNDTQVSTYDGDQWRGPSVVRSLGESSVLGMWRSDGKTMVCARDGHRLSLGHIDNGVWNPLRETVDVKSAEHCVAAPWAGGVALATSTGDESIAWANWTNDEIVWKNMTAISRMRVPHKQSPIATVGSFAFLAAVLAYVFWYRHDSMTQLFELPSDCAIAGLLRRSVAFIIDVIPVLMVTITLWWPPLKNWTIEYQAQRGGEEATQLPPDLIVGWGLFCLAYVAYSFVCELLIGATPGKRATGCVVLSESGSRCTAGQLLVRNGMRLFELFPMYMGLPSLVLMIFTLNRQRLGDLLARTIVVKRTSSAQPSNAQGDSVQ